MLDAHARLDVVLARLSQTIDLAPTLAVGDVLHIPIEALQSVTLDSPDNKFVAVGFLGQAGGQKPVWFATHQKSEDAAAEPVKFFWSGRGASGRFRWLRYQER